MSTQETKKYEDSCSKVKDYVNSIGIQCYSSVFLKELTSDFHESSFVGRGGYGVVYKGTLGNGEIVAIKNLEKMKEIVAETTFMAEISTMSNTNHKNLIKLKGYCFEPDLKALVYEYMENGSLDSVLYKSDSSIEWETFYSIAVEVAEGLMYFHRGSNDQIIHYDIKAGNVLLDKKFSPKIADFGLAKLFKRDVSGVPLSGIRGSGGYTAPELYTPGYGSVVTNKCDLYSFGMLLFEILGNRNVSNQQGESFPRQVWDSFKQGELELERLLEEIGITMENREKAKSLTKVALLCIQDHPDDRPTMKEVWLMLDKVIPILREPPLPSRLWRTSSMTSSLEWANSDRISEEDIFCSNGSNESRSNQDLGSILSSLKDNTPGSTVSVVQEESHQPSTMEEGLEGTQKKVIYEDGSIYDGTWKNGLRHGKGKFVWSNGNTYDGDWKDDLQEGTGKYQYKNGDYYEGAYKKGVREGKGKFVYLNKREYTGDFRNNLEEGKGKLVFKNGDEYTGEFKNGKREGHGTYRWKNGDYHEGTYKNSMKEGEGNFFGINGEKYSGGYRNENREGRGRLITAKGDEYDGEYKKGKPEGHGTYVWNDGDKYAGEYRNGVREGQGRFTFKNGSYHEGTYRNDLRDGPGTFVYANGEKYVGEWIKGNKVQQ